MRIVQKFGGSSLATAERIHAAAVRVRNARARGEQPIVVVSAIAATTDALLLLAGQTAPRSAQGNQRELDALLATGEQMSAALLALALHDLGVNAISLTAVQVGILTDDKHGDASIHDVQATRLERALALHQTPVVAGFQGVTRQGDVTTLGRGGSDTTAVALAVALRAVRCDIYTDVDGVYTADPRQHTTARRYRLLSHEAALQLARSGAAVLHPRAAALAAQHELPLRVLSSFDADDNHGTIIAGDECSFHERQAGQLA